MSCPLPLGSQHHVDKALNLIGKKFKELNLTNIYAPPLPSLALPSLPMTSWVSVLSGISVLVPSPKLIPVERLLACGPSKHEHVRFPLRPPLGSAAGMFSEDRVECWEEARAS